MSASALRFAVIGSPVAHSKSPAMHGAAYKALGLSHTYEKIETSDAELEDRVKALRDGVFAGLNVTVPHKTNVLGLVDEVDASAEATGAANTLVRLPNGRVRAHNTDAPAIAEELIALASSKRDAFRGKSAIVIGTGGAARAALYALGSLGVSMVIVRGRTQKDALRDVFAAGSGSAASLQFESLHHPRKNELEDLAVIVQATSAGMDGSSMPGDLAAFAVDWKSVQSACVAYDVVYAPKMTPFLERARTHGMAYDNGLGMLVRQGALAFELWLGQAPPLDVMRAAVL